MYWNFSSPCPGAGLYLFSKLGISWASSIWKQSSSVLGTISDDFIDYIFCSSSQIPLRCLVSACWIVCLHPSYPRSSFLLPFPLFILLSRIFPPLYFLILLLGLSLLWFLSLGRFFLLVFWMFLLIAPCSCSWVWCPFSLRVRRTASCCWHSCESFVSFGQSVSSELHFSVGCFGSYLLCKRLFADGW